MNTRELRIGNYVYVTEVMAEVISIFDEDIEVRLHGKIITSKHPHTDVHPIPIAQRILDNYCQTEKGKIVLGLNTFHYYLVLKDEDHIIILNEDQKPAMHFWDIKYFHQLQNLYFILKGEELLLRAPKADQP